MTTFWAITDHLVLASSNNSVICSIKVDLSWYVGVMCLHPNFVDRSLTPSAKYRISNFLDLNSRIVSSFITLIVFPEFARKVRLTSHIFHNLVLYTPVHVQNSRVTDKNDF